MEGVKIGEIREKPGWIGTYRSCMWVTNRGLHFTVGKSSGDFHYFLSFNSVQSVEANNGVRINKFVFETDEGKVRFPTIPLFDIDPVASFIEQKILARKEMAGRGAARKKKAAQMEVKPFQSAENTGEVSLTTLQQMDAYDFEYIIARVWKKRGWETQVTSGSGDRGVDITAVKSDPFEQRQYIQVKRYAANNKVGSNEIQKSSGLYARNESVDAVVVVTTSEFTSEARKIAANRNVKLINGAQLIKMIKRHDISVT
ncbi:restriction endonuclease [Haloferax marinisediminis]|uniref:restriction endonuclease n=1 Tax=Haloferax marinisediminis TaxID=2666142 RepID=UPI0018A1D4FA|nr:restriction endonuclease [Haloferax marinisediminis]